MFVSLAVVACSSLLAVSAMPRPSMDPRPVDRDMNEDVWRPPFLMNAPKEVAESFDKMIGSSGDLTDKEIEDAVEQWVKHQPESIQANYIKFKQDRDFYEAAAEAEKQKILSQMSPETRLAYQQVMGIFTHPTLKAEDKMTIIEKLLNAMPEETRNQVQMLLQ